MGLQPVAAALKRLAYGLCWLLREHPRMVSAPLLGGDRCDMPRNVNTKVVPASSHLAKCFYKRLQRRPGAVRHAPAGGFRGSTTVNLDCDTRADVITVLVLAERHVFQIKSELSI